MSQFLSIGMRTLIATNRPNADAMHVTTGLRCRPAESREDYTEAFRLLYRQYCAAGLSRTNPTRMRIARHQLALNCETLVVDQDKKKIVGTLSLIGDSKNKLPLDHYFSEAIQKLRREGLRLVEVGCLASEDRASPTPSNVYSALTRATIQYANAGGYDRMIAAVHPRHCKLYERGMGFKRISDVVRCDMVEGNLAVCVAGNPRDPLAFQEPWREIFFGGSGQDFIQRNRAMSPIDRMHFTRILEIAERFDLSANRRAA